MRTGAEYKESLRDGRDVWVMGEGAVADVTTDPSTSAMVDEYVAWYDRHFDTDWQDILLTPPDGNGQRFPLALTPPQITKDLIYWNDVDTYPKWSPDGGHVAFVKRGEYREDVAALNKNMDTIHIAKADGSDLRLIYPTGEHLALHQPFTRVDIKIIPAWSPDGSRLAFVGHYAHLSETDSKDDVLYELLYVVGWDGSGVRPSCPAATVSSCSTPALSSGP